MTNRRVWVATGIAFVSVVLIVLLLCLMPGGRPYSDSTSPTPRIGTAPADRAQAPRPKRVWTPPGVDLSEEEENADGAGPAADLLAEIAELNLNPDVDAICRIEPPVQVGQGHLLLGNPEEPPPYNGRLVRIVLGNAYLPLLDEFNDEGLQTGWLTVPGYRPTRVSWTKPEPGTRGRCSPDPVLLQASNASVTGTVVNAEGEPEGKVFVEGCGNQAWTDVDGGYFLDIATGPCTLQAFRRDGLWAAHAEAVELSAKSGEELVVDFKLPPERRGGLGMKVEATDGGIRIDGVIEGGDAEEQGVQSGDLVVAINGESTEDMPLEDFVHEAVGPEGTTVSLLIRRGREELEMELERRALQ